MARLREAEGDLDAALALLDEADRVYVGDYSPNVQPVPAVRARLRLRRGELDRGRGVGARAAASPRTTSCPTCASTSTSPWRGSCSPGTGRERDGSALEDALEPARSAARAAQDGGRGGSVLEVLVLQALALQARGDVPAALAGLQRAVTLAQPEGYVRLFADEGPPMAALLKALTQQATIGGYARRLLAATTSAADHATDEHEHRPDRPPALVEPLSDRELDVLRLLGTDLDGPDIARALSVSLNTMRTHTKNIYAKLGVTSRRAAVRQAQRARTCCRARAAADDRAAARGFTTALTRRGDDPSPHRRPSFDVFHRTQRRRRRA